MKSIIRLKAINIIVTVTFFLVLMELSVFPDLIFKIDKSERTKATTKMILSADDKSSFISCKSLKAN